MIEKAISINKQHFPSTLETTHQEVYFTPAYAEATSHANFSHDYTKEVTHAIDETLSHIFDSEMQRFISGRGLVNELLRVSGPYERRQKEAEFFGRYVVLNREEYTVVYAGYRFVEDL